MKTQHVLGAALTALLAFGCGDDTTTEAPAAPSDVGADVTSLDDTGGSDGTGDTVTPVDSAGDQDTTGPEPDAGPPPCIAGLDCDDGNPCTRLDQCLDGFCVGEAYACDDGRECTTDECDGDGGCVFSVALGYCLIGNQCLTHASANPNNSCERCDTDLNRIGWSVVADSSHVTMRTVAPSVTTAMEAIASPDWRRRATTITRVQKTPVTRLSLASTYPSPVTAMMATNAPSVKPARVESANPSLPPATTTIRVRPIPVLRTSVSTRRVQRPCDDDACTENEFVPRAHARAAPR